MDLFFLAVSEVAKNPEVQTTFWEWVLMVTGGITVVSGAGVIVWRVAIRPHFLEFVLKASEVHKSVTVNGGQNSPPTLLDKVHEQSKDIRSLSQIVKASDNRTKDLGDKVDLLSELTQDTRNDLRAHEEHGAKYLGQVEIVLRDKGIELPPRD